MVKKGQSYVDYQENSINSDLKFAFKLFLELCEYVYDNDIKNQEQLNKINRYKSIFAGNNDMFSCYFSQLLKNGEIDKFINLFNIITGVIKDSRITIDYLQIVMNDDNFYFLKKSMERSKGRKWMEKLLKHERKIMQ